MGKLNALMDLETLEVSLVESGANRKKFAITKSEDGRMSKVIEAIKSAPMENAGKLLELLKQGELSEEASAAFMEALKLLSAFQEEIPEALWREMLALAGAPEEVEAQEDEEEEEKLEMQDEEEMEKSLAKAPKELQERLRSLWKTQGESQGKIEALQKALDTEREDRVTKEYAVRAKEEFAGVPGIATDELGILLKNLDLMDAGISRKVQGILKASAMAAKASDLTKEFGTSGAADDGDAYRRATSMGAEIRKSDPKLSESQARRKVWNDNPKLYAEYRKQQRG